MRTANIERLASNLICLPAMMEICGHENFEGHEPYVKDPDLAVFVRWLANPEDNRELVDEIFGGRENFDKLKDLIVAGM